MWQIWDVLWLVSYWILRPVMMVRFRLRKNSRVRILVCNEDQIFLVKNSFGRHYWTLPGGGIEKNETPEIAAARELYEEIGMQINAKMFRKIGETPYGFEDNLGYKSIILAVNVIEKPPISLRRWEIMDAKWFHRGELPEHLAKIVDKSLEIDPKILQK